MKLKNFAIHGTWNFFRIISRALGKGKSKHANQDVNDIIIHEVIQILHITDKDLILDAGCGSGFAIKALAKRQIKSVGIDYVSRFEPMDSNNSYCSFINGNLTNLPFTSQLFDKIFCYGTLHYIGPITEIKKVLLEFKRVTKPGGSILLGEIIQKKRYFNDYIVKAKMNFIKKCLLLCYLNSPLYQYFFYKQDDLEKIFTELGFSFTLINQKKTMPYHKNMKHYLLQNFN